MKKFLAIMFALIFALSCATTAFAADLTCRYCSESFSSEKAYNEHIAEKCPVLFPEKPAAPMVCEECGAAFKDAEQYNIHITEIHVPKASWGDQVGEFFLGLDYSDFKSVLDKITEALTGIGLPGLLVKVIDLLEQGVNALIGEIK